MVGNLQDIFQTPISPLLGMAAAVMCKLPRPNQQAATSFMKSLRGERGRFFPRQQQTPTLVLGRYSSCVSLLQGDHGHGQKSSFNESSKAPNKKLVSALLFNQHGASFCPYLHNAGAPNKQVCLANISKKATEPLHPELARSTTENHS